MTNTTRRLTGRSPKNPIIQELDNDLLSGITKSRVLARAHVIRRTIGTHRRFSALINQLDAWIESKQRT